MSQKQKLELTWIGKENRPKLEPRILIEDAEKSFGNSKAENMLIHGDNLLALKALEQEFAGKVKCVYIDPPYNTGSAFEHYDDGIEHSLWLSLIRDRLEILWKLLESEGSLWVSIDDYEMPYLRVLMDEVCGRSAFVATNVWQKRYSRENREAIGDVHEYLLVYAKNVGRFKKIRNLIPITEEQAKIYKNPNNDPQGRWRGIPMTAQGFRPNQMYSITTPTGVVHHPPEGRCWSTIESEFLKLREKGRIWFGKDGNSQPNTIRYLSEVEGMVPWTWWPSDEVGHTDEAKKEIHGLFGKIDAFDTPKPERLIQRILQISTCSNDLVLDSFLGSGTTAAVAQKMGRRWIGIELGEHCHTHCIPRLQKVLDGTDQGGISEAVGWKGGGGFKFYNLAPSLLKKDKYGNFVIDENYNANMLAAAMAKHEGFKYQPDAEIYWKQGQSTERDFIFTTTQFVTVKLLDQIQQEMKSEESVLVCCKSFQKACENKFSNITIKKIPKMLLGRCEFGKNDYSLNIISMPQDPNAPEFVPVGPEKKPEPVKKKRKPIASQMDFLD
ncbi:MAG: site-specific DNA-methyltransferase [Deltaproteobacteria bacterium]|nr:site-specific DNA-methyltransferase [Deltaproteobacteria bacterium]